MGKKLIRKSFFLSLSVICLGFFSGKAYLLHKRKKRMNNSIAIVDKPIKVIVFSENEKILQSAKSQDYKNFEIIQMKDITTFSFSQMNPENTINKRVIDKFRKFDPDDILVIVDNNCWFAHDHVLSKLNEVYNFKNASSVSGKELVYPTYSLVNDPLHIRCFVAKALFKKEDQNFQYDDSTVKIDDVMFFTRE